jgi:dienelactone hydrolase
MTLETYDADLAFVNDTRPEVYDEKNAKLAWQRSLEFLKKNLG